MKRLPNMIAHVREVLISARPDTLVSTPLDFVEATLEGFPGDKHAGWTRLSDSRTPWYKRGTVIRNDRQVSVVSEEELAWVAEKMGLAALPAGWLGANLLISGIPNLTRLPKGTRLAFSGGAVLVVQAENMPCSGPGKVIEEETGRKGAASLFPKAALHRRGLTACVEKAGRIAPGDELAVEMPE